LKQDCPKVLDAIAAKTNVQIPVTNAFPTRAMGSMTEYLMGGCLNTSDACSSEADVLAAGTTGQAQAALLKHALTFGLATGNLLVQGGTVAQALVASGGETDMTSLTQGVTSQGGAAPPAQTNQGPKPTSSISESAPGSGAGSPTPAGSAQ
jgi:hypothetical protein